MCAYSWVCKSLQECSWPSFISQSGIIQGETCKLWDYRQTSPWPVYEGLGIGSRVLCMLVTCSTNWVHHQDVNCLLNFQKYIMIFEESHSAIFPLKLFWWVCYLIQLISTISNCQECKQLFLIYFDSCPLGKGLSHKVIFASGKYRQLGNMVFQENSRQDTNYNSCLRFEVSHCSSLICSRWSGYVTQADLKFRHECRHLVFEALRKPRQEN